MTESTSTPASAIISTFKSTNSWKQAFDAGLEKLVEVIGCERAGIILLVGSRFKVTNSHSKKESNSYELGKSLDFQKSAILMISALHSADIMSVTPSSNSQWQGYFELSGSKSGFHELLFLRSAKSAYGLISLESEEKLDLTASKEKQLTETADLVLAALQTYILNLENEIGSQSTKNLRFL